MPKPDLEFVHDEYYRAYYRGRIFDINLMATGWAITQGTSLNPIHFAPSVDDATAWLTQATFV